MNSETKKQFKNFFELERYENRYKLFEDVISMIAYSISNLFDYQHYMEREEAYKKIAKKYSKETLLKASEIMAGLVIDLEKNPSDVLGRLYMELAISSDDLGQFFTPDDMTKLMADLVIDEEIESKIEDQGYVSMIEPTCGSGGFVVGLANIMLGKGYNPQKQLYVVAQDLDRLAVKMCYIQLSLLGIPAIVKWGDTLKDEVREIWRTPGYYLAGMGVRMRGEDLFCRDSADIDKEKLQIEENGQISLEI